MPTSRHERAFRRAGYRAIAGLDEAGRGALFGPVFAAAVMLDPGASDSRPGRQQAARRRSGAKSWRQRIRERAVPGRWPPPTPSKSITGIFCRPRAWPCAAPWNDCRRPAITCWSTPSASTCPCRKSPDSRRCAMLFDRRASILAKVARDAALRGLGRGLPRVRLRGQQGLRHAGAPGRARTAGSHHAASLQLRAGPKPQPLPTAGPAIRSRSQFLSKANCSHVPDAGIGLDSRFRDAPHGWSKPGGPRRTPRLLRLCFAIFTFEIGLFLTVFPWVDIWSLNYFSGWLPGLENVWDDPYFRGAITGLGSREYLRGLRGSPAYLSPFRVTP